MTDLHLEPCPFCGGKAEHKVTHPDAGQMESLTQCTACKAGHYSVSTSISGGAPIPENTAKKWNTRAARPSAEDAPADSSPKNCPICDTKSVLDEGLVSCCNGDCPLHDVGIYPITWASLTVQRHPTVSAPGLREALEEALSALHGSCGAFPKLRNMANVDHAIKLSESALAAHPANDNQGKKVA